MSRAAAHGRPRLPVGRGVALGLAALLSAGCGGGLPLLHPARTLAAGDIRAAAGMGANIAVGSLGNAVRQAELDPNTSVSPPPSGDTAYAKGALVLASVGPGLQPFAAARVGMGAQFEGGISYTGRALRFDVRRSFDLTRTWSISIGAGGEAALYGHQDGSAIPNVSLNQLHGWGGDVPLLLGYESAGSLYMLWVGARAGGEHVDISDVTSEPKAVTLGSPPIALSATRYWGGGLIGFAVGFRHLHVALELDAAYAVIKGTYNDTSATVSGVSLAPATALWWEF